MARLLAKLVAELVIRTVSIRLLVSDCWYLTVGIWLTVYLVPLISDLLSEKWSYLAKFIWHSWWWPPGTGHSSHGISPFEASWRSSKRSSTQASSIHQRWSVAQYDFLLDTCAHLRLRYLRLRNLRSRYLRLRNPSWRYIRFAKRGFVLHTRAATAAHKSWRKQNKTNKLYKLELTSASTGPVLSHLVAKFIALRA